MKSLDTKTVLLVIVFVTLGCNNCTSRSQSHNTERNRRSINSEAPLSARVSQSNSSTPQANNSTRRVNDSEPQCDPNYSPCVPIASDVDCAGGHGDGPAYVKGPVRVIGKVTAWIEIMTVLGASKLDQRLLVITNL
jgi:hypothetical protein